MKQLPRHPLITLTTDFGERDPYVAVMKGVILGICPGAQLIDLSHEIAPQDVFEASLFLAQAAPRFPPGSIHLAVIDPGVGSARLPLAVKTAHHTFICPDNGLLTHFLKEEQTTYTAYRLANPRYQLNEQSTTFHGRDIFAPAAAFLARGLDIRQFGPAQEQIVLLTVPEPATGKDGTICGEIVHIDRFGNAISNLHRTYVQSETTAGNQGYTRGGLEKKRPGADLLPVVPTYSALPPQTPCLLWGSSGYLEIAINQGHAAHTLGIQRGDKVFLYFD